MNGMPAPPVRATLLAMEVMFAILSAHLFEVSQVSNKCSICFPELQSNTVSIVIRLQALFGDLPVFKANANFQLTEARLAAPQHRKEKPQLSGQHQRKHHRAESAGAGGVKWENLEGKKKKEMRNGSFPLPGWRGFLHSDSRDKTYRAGISADSKHSEEEKEPYNAGWRGFSVRSQEMKDSQKGQITKLY